jgi:hypothetical protein
MEIPHPEVLEIFKRLAEPLPKEAVQRTKKEISKKGYDTTGYSYQYCVNRFNEVLGNAWGYTHRILRETTGTFKSGTPFFEFTIETSIWILSPDNTRSCFGGHISSVHADAMKGAFTNSFKKTAAMFGVGREAFEGSLDDDATYEDDVNTKSAPKTEPTKKPALKTEPKTEQVKQPEPIQERLPETGNVGNTEISTAPERPTLTFEQIKEKMATSENIFKLNNRCKKYRPDYDQLDKEHQTFIKIERDKRKVWLTLGEGNYTDLETKGINKEIKEGE